MVEKLCRQHSRLYFLLLLLLKLSIQPIDGISECGDEIVCALEYPEKEYRVLQGSTVHIPCKVAASNGSRLLNVFWRVKGFFLDKGSTLDRVNISGESDGDFMLRISNAMFDDSGELECQILGPRVQGSAVRQYKTVLTVLIPPMKPVINSGIRQLSITNLSHPVQVACECNEGFPGVHLSWHLDELPISNAYITRESQTSSKIRRYVSRLTLIPEKHDVVNGSRLDCRAHNEALDVMARSDPDTRIRQPSDSLTLLVYERVGAPSIGHLRYTYRSGSRLELTCSALPGIPTGQLLWKRKRRTETEWSIVSATHQLIDARLVNIIGLTVDSQDHLALFACESSNIAMEKPDSAVVMVNVSFTPDRLFMYLDNQLVTDKVYIRDGEQVNFQCRSGPYHDNLTVIWYLDGEEMFRNLAMPAKEYSGQLLEQYILSNYSFVFSADRNRNHDIRCAVANRFGDRLQSSLRLHEHIPAKELRITAPTRIRANEISEFTCLCHGAAPMPSITWYLDNEQIRVQPMAHIDRTQIGSSVRSVLQINVTRADYNKVIFCRAETPTIPRYNESDKIKLDVFFPPIDKPRLTFKSVPMKRYNALAAGAAFYENDQLQATCQGNGSNPKMLFTWQIAYCFHIEGTQCKIQDPDREELKPDQMDLKHRPSIDHEGFDGQSLVRFRLTAKHNLAILFCLANNPEFPGVVTRAMTTLHVRHQPVIYGLGRDVTVMQDSTEARSVIIRSNPALTPESVQVYQLSSPLVTSGVGGRKRSEKVRYSDGSLIFERLSTEDAGRYSLEASNELGLGSHSFEVFVRMPLRITHIDVLGESTHLDDRTYFVRNRQRSTWSAKIEAIVEGSPIVLNSLGSSARWDIPIRRRRTRGGPEAFDNGAILQLGCHEHREGFTVGCSSTRTDGTVIKEAKFFLLLLNLTESNMGEYRLSVHNGVGQPHTRTLRLYPALEPPRINAEHMNNRAAVSDDSNATLACTAAGVPPVRVVWSKRRSSGDNDFTPLTTFEKRRARMWHTNLSDALYTRWHLSISPVLLPDDLGVYRCAVECSNCTQTSESLPTLYPAAAASIHVTKQSPPDPPSVFYVFNLTANSALVTWRPGHNGGSRQTFRVGCRKAGSSSSRFSAGGSNAPSNGGFIEYDVVDHMEQELLTLDIPNLMPSTTYELQLTTTNDLFPNHTVRFGRLVTFVTPDDPNRRMPSQHLEAEHSARSLLITGSALVGIVIILSCLLYVLHLVRQRKGGHGTPTSMDHETRHRRSHPVANNDDLDDEFRAFQQQFQAPIQQPRFVQHGAYLSSGGTLTLAASHQPNPPCYGPTSIL